MTTQTNNSAAADTLVEATVNIETALQNLAAAVHTYRETYRQLARQAPTTRVYGGERFQLEVSISDQRLYVVMAGRLRALGLAGILGEGTAGPVDHTWLDALARKVEALVR
jgi:hypothetical protein